MRKRSSITRRSKEKDEGLDAIARLFSDPTVSPGKNPAAVYLGRLGGKKGGPARAARLSARQRSLIARKAAEARWLKEPRKGQ